MLQKQKSKQKQDDSEWLGTSLVQKSKAKPFQNTHTHKQNLSYVT